MQEFVSPSPSGRPSRSGNCCQPNGYSACCAESVSRAWASISIRRMGWQRVSTTCGSAYRIPTRWRARRCLRACPSWNGKEWRGMRSTLLIARRIWQRAAPKQIWPKSGTGPAVHPCCRTRKSGRAYCPVAPSSFFPFLFLSDRPPSLPSIRPDAAIATGRAAPPQTAEACRKIFFRMPS